MSACDEETCYECGHTWRVVGAPRDWVLCSGCATAPRPPTGQVRRDPDGITAVCLGGDRDQRWKVIGEDPWAITYYGWRADRDVRGWTVLGNALTDLPAREAVAQR